MRLEGSSSQKSRMEVRAGNDGRSMSWAGVPVGVSAEIVGIDFMAWEPAQNHKPSSTSVTSVSEETARSRCVPEMEPPNQIVRNVNRDRMRTSATSFA